MHCFQSVAPFGVSTRMAGFQKATMITFSPEDFVKYSLQYVSAGDKTNGSICHTVLVRLRVANIMPKTATKRLTCSIVCVCACVYRAGCCRLFHLRFSMQNLWCKAYKTTPSKIECRLDWSKSKSMCDRHAGVLQIISSSPLAFLFPSTG